MKLPENTRRNQVILLILVIVIAIPSLYIYDYTQNNPRFCLTCHLMNNAYDSWHVSAMHDISCHNCHETTMAESMEHVFDVLTKNPNVVTKPVVIDNSMCETCHVSNDPQWLQIANTAGHKVHIFGNNDSIECIDCHGLNLHVFEPPSDTCVQCHDVAKVHATEEMNTTCVSCHNFLANGTNLIPGRSTCLECHTDRELTLSMPDGAHVNTTCTNCHNPHGTVTAVDCTSCHMNVSGGLHDVSAHTDCTSCHVPHEDVTVRDTCVTCHTDKVDHYAPVSCITCHN
jgi:hypothetical protein